MKNNQSFEPKNDGNLRRAWIWLVLVPVGSLVGQLLGHLLASALGVPESTPFQGSMWQKLLITVPTALLTVIPGFVAAFYGNKVVKEGNKIGYLHLYLGGLYSLFMLVVSVLTFAGVGQ